MSLEDFLKTVSSAMTALKKGFDEGRNNSYKPGNSSTRTRRSDKEYKKTGTMSLFPGNVVLQLFVRN